MDGTLLDFTEWDKGEPKNITGNNCVALSLTDRSWRTDDCLKDKTFVCKVANSFYKTTTIPLTTTTTPSTTTTSFLTTNCYGIIFAAEMSQSISLQQKIDFYNIVLKIAEDFRYTNLQFAITTYGTTIYQNLNDFKGYNDFVKLVNGLISDLPNPNSALTYIAPVLNNIYNDLLHVKQKGVSVLIMGEMEAIRDPNAGYAAANKIASTGKNIYVLDNSIGAIPTRIWVDLTKNHQERIINGTGNDFATFYNKLYDTIVTDIKNNNC